MESLVSGDQNPSGELAAKQTDTREEGELSSSSEDDECPASSDAQELPACSISLAKGTISLTAEPNLTLPANKWTEGNRAGKSISISNSANSAGIPSRAFIQPNSHKSIEKKVPVNSGPPGRYRPSGRNSSLVICFSDDDSDSDSEHHRQDKCLETKFNAVGVDGSRKPPIPLLSKPVVQQRTAKSEIKGVGKQFPLSRTFISPVTKIHGANSRGVGLSSVEQRPSIRNSNALNKTLSSRARSCAQAAGVNHSKLQDLRQQIAMRESEMKLKYAQQNREAVSSSVKDVTNKEIDAVARCNTTSTEAKELDLKEPEKKRLKVEGPYFGHQSSDGLQDGKVLQASKEPSMQQMIKVDCNNAIVEDRTESSVLRWQKRDDRQRVVSAENLPDGLNRGANTNSNWSKSDKGIRQVDSSVVLNQDAPLANTISKSQNDLNNVELNHLNNNRHNSVSSFPEKVTIDNDLPRGSDYHGVKSAEKTLKLMSNDACQESLNNASLYRCFGNGNVPRNNIDIESLIEMEEMKDKELEEAQEHRRRCEIEERNALKTYRRAQRALIEANTRCNRLYHQRECSSQIRSFIMDDSGLLWPSTCLEHDRIGLNSSKHASEDNVDQIPTSSHQMHVGFDVFNQEVYGSNIQCVNDAIPNTSYQHVNGQSLGSEPCSEPDASTSELFFHMGKNAANAFGSPSNDPTISVDEDEEIFPHEYKRKEIDSEEGEGDTKKVPNEKSLICSSQDSLLLEATLRSELFTRLGVRTLPKKDDSSYTMEFAVERGAEYDMSSEKSPKSDGGIPFHEAEKFVQPDLSGANRLENTNLELAVQIHDSCDVEKCSLRSHSIADLEESKFSILKCRHFTMSIMRSAFTHMKDMSSLDFIEFQTTNQKGHNYNIYGDEVTCVDSNEIQSSYFVENKLRGTIRDVCRSDVGSYTCNDAVDPFWPLCMYELRGKCNNDECSWQHVKDYSEKDSDQHDHIADCLVGSSSQCVKCNGTRKPPHHPDFSAELVYLVGLDILKANSRINDSVLARGSAQCWKKCYSISLAVSNVPQIDFPAHEPFFHGSDGRIEVNGTWDRQSLYFQCRNGAMNQPKQGSDDYIQSLEMALLILNQEDNKLEGMKKALFVLSRAIEADPTCSVLWIVYLLIFNSNKSSFKMDDMFSCAVKHSERSYELWLMYIDSRTQLNDRLDAYDAALSALCGHASTSDRDVVHASACILDLVLQMLDCFCMSGNVMKAIHRVHALFPAEKESDEPHPLLFSDILTCLTISDRCIFWVCCIYLLIYRKLPDAIVERFEGEKELPALEWPSVNLIGDEKQDAVKLVEMAVDSVESSITVEYLDSKFTLRSKYMFALNHIRCMMALDDLNCSRSLLENYNKLYPSCLEFVLISARMQKHDYEELGLGFEEAISNWPKGVPGVQCLWNQYAEHALQIGRNDFVKELMIRWFDSVWKVEWPQSGILDTYKCENSRSSLDSALVSKLQSLISNSNQIDVMFGFLNLSLHRLLENDYAEARLAIDIALKVADSENYKFCLKEHAMFLFKVQSQIKEDIPISLLLNMLNDYLDGSRCPVPILLSQNFLNDVKKPRVQQLTCNILSPVSTDFSQVNLVLEAWYGPSLLPQKFSKPKDMVDFVEAILHISPSNYQFAISICKLLIWSDKSTDCNSPSLLFWASFLLVSAIFHAMPIAPEFVWVDAADILSNITGVDVMFKKFHKRALSVYPFSVKLWKSYYNLSKTTGDTSIVVAAAIEKGISLD